MKMHCSKHEYLLEMFVAFKNSSPNTYAIILLSRKMQHVWGRLINKSVKTKFTCLQATNLGMVAVL